MAETRFPKIPKVREPAEITFLDGSTLEGHLFIEATTRVQDLLNGPSLFFPFVDRENTLHLVNKHSIARVRPVD